MVSPTQPNSVWHSSTKGLCQCQERLQHREINSSHWQLIDWKDQLTKTLVQKIILIGASSPWWRLQSPVTVSMLLSHSWMDVLLATWLANGIYSQIIVCQTLCCCTNYSVVLVIYHTMEPEQYTRQHCVMIVCSFLQYFETSFDVTIFLSGVLFSFFSNCLPSHSYFHHVFNSHCLLVYLSRLGPLSLSAHLLRTNLLSSWYQNVCLSSANDSCLQACVSV